MIQFAGSEGVGVVVKVGPGVDELHVQDWVVPKRPGTGTWRTMGVFKASDLIKVPTDIIPQQYMAVINVLCTAFRMLDDFERLQSGDCIVQTGEKFRRIFKVIDYRCQQFCRSSSNPILSSA